jgi:hypothetical protein
MNLPLQFNLTLTIKSHHVMRTMLILYYYHCRPNSLSLFMIDKFSAQACVPLLKDVASAAAVVGTKLSIHAGDHSIITDTATTGNNAANVSSSEQLAAALKAVADSCASATTAAECNTAGGHCVSTRDGYNVQVLVCTVLGIVWLTLSWREVLRLQSLKQQEWHIAPGRDSAKAI